MKRLFTVLLLSSLAVPQDRIPDHIRANAECADPSAACVMMSPLDTYQLIQSQQKLIREQQDLLLKMNRHIEELRSVSDKEERVIKDQDLLLSLDQHLLKLCDSPKQRASNEKPSR